MVTETEAPALPLDDSPQPQNGASSQSRLDQAYCLRRAEWMFGCYRRDEANDPEIYCAAIAAVLSDYPRAIVEYVTDPRVGIPSRIKWPPSVAEVMEACDAEMKRVETMSKPIPNFRKREYMPPRTDPGCWANCFVGPESPNYAAAVEFTKAPDTDARAWRFGEFRGISGVWLAYPNYETIRLGGGRMAGKTWQSMSDAALRAHYGAEEAKRAEKEFTE